MVVLVRFLAAASKLLAIVWTVRFLDCQAKLGALDQP